MDAQEATIEQPEAIAENVQDANEAGQPTTEANSMDSLPEWAKGLVKDLRTENAKHRTAKKAAEKEAAQAEEQQLLAKGQIQEAYDKVRSEFDTLQAELKASEQMRLKM